MFVGEGSIEDYEKISLRSTLKFSTKNRSRMYWSKLREPWPVTSWAIRAWGVSSVKTCTIEYTRNFFETLFDFSASESRIQFPEIIWTNLQLSSSKSSQFHQSFRLNWLLSRNNREYDKKTNKNNKTVGKWKNMKSYDRKKRKWEAKIGELCCIVKTYICSFGKADTSSIEKRRAIRKRVFWHLYF